MLNLLDNAIVIINVIKNVIEDVEHKIQTDRQKKPKSRNEI